MVDKKGIGRDGLPTEEGVYLAKGILGELTPKEIDVYKHPIRGLCCYGPDFDDGTADYPSEDDCHIPVNNLKTVGLEFITKVRGLNQDERTKLG